VATKSNLKKDEKAAAEKRNVTFGKSTTYEVDANIEDESGEYQTKDVGSKGSPRPESDKEKKVIAEKDLSDGRSEKEKILEMLEKKQREELEEIKEMNQWKRKQDEGKANYEDSVGDSSSSNPPPMPHKKIEHSSGSYESDDFEEASASGSGSRSKMNIWPPKTQGIETNKSKKDDESNNYNPNAMEEYLKKQKAMQAA